MTDYTLAEVIERYADKLYANDHRSADADKCEMHMLSAEIKRLTTELAEVKRRIEAQESRINDDRDTVVFIADQRDALRDRVIKLEYALHSIMTGCHDAGMDDVSTAHEALRGASESFSQLNTFTRDIPGRTDKSKAAPAEHKHHWLRKSSVDYRCVCGASMFDPE